MNQPQNSPKPEASIGDANVDRLLANSYHPEEIDPDFVQRMHALAHEEAVQRTDQDDLPVRSAQNGGGYLFAWVAAAALCLMVAGYLWIQTQRDVAPPFYRDGAVVWIDGQPYVPVEEGEENSGEVAVVPSPSHSRVSAKIRRVGMKWMKPRPVPEREQLPRLAAGDSLETKAGQRKRVTLADGTELYINEETKVRALANRKIQLERGEVYLDVSPAKGKSDPFVVATAKHELTALGTKFAVSVRDQAVDLSVTQGKVRVSGLKEHVEAGQQLSMNGDKPQLSSLRRATHVLHWTKELVEAGDLPLVPRSRHRGGSLVAVDPNGQEMKLSLRKYHVDVHIEDGFARTTIDQTYFNHHTGRLEGTFYFPLPADASISRLAMYVNGVLMEGGMAERQHARNVFESIKHRALDPALLEWIDGSTFKMRVFPLEGRQEKRIVLSYTQKLNSDYGRTEYRFPAGHNMNSVREWSTQVHVHNGAERGWKCETHKLTSEKKGKNLVLKAKASYARLDRDLVIQLEKIDNGGQSSQVATTSHEGFRYWIVRHWPELEAQERTRRRDWVLLFDADGSRNPLLARVQIEAIRGILDNAQDDDTFSLITAGTRIRAFDEKPLPINKENIEKAIQFLENTHLVGAMDLEKALKVARSYAAAATDPTIVHVGAAFPIVGERSSDRIVKEMDPKIPYVAVAVGKRWNRQLIKAATSLTNGYYTQVNPDESAAWKTKELMATLNSTRLTQIEAIVAGQEQQGLLLKRWARQGEEVSAVFRVASDAGSPKSVKLRGKIDGKTFEKEISLTEASDNASYLPRIWAKQEIDRLLALDAESHKTQIIELSKKMYVMSPYTSLLVLENDAMYTQYKVDRGREDHWALYPCPKKIDVVKEPLPGVQSPKMVKGKDDRPAMAKILQTVLLQRPQRQTVTANTVWYGMSVPDGGTIMLGGIKVRPSTDLSFDVNGQLNASHFVAPGRVSRQQLGYSMLASGVDQVVDSFGSQIRMDFEDRDRQNAIEMDRLRERPVDKWTRYRGWSRNWQDGRNTTTPWVLGTEGRFATSRNPRTSFGLINGRSVSDLRRNFERSAPVREMFMRNPTAIGRHLGQPVTAVDFNADGISASYFLDVNRNAHRYGYFAPNDAYLVEFAEVELDQEIQLGFRPLRSQLIAGEQQVLNKLQTVTQVQWRSRSLQDVLNDLSRRYGVRLEIQPAATQIRKDIAQSRVTLQANNLRLRQVLDRVLPPLGLTFYVAPRGIMVTTRKDAEEKTRTRSYWLDETLMLMRVAKASPAQKKPEDEEKQQATLGEWAANWWADRLAARVSGQAATPRLNYPSLQSIVRNDVFARLVDFMPGFGSSVADVLAVLETESDIAVPKAGKIDDGARKLIEKARESGWYRLKIKSLFGDYDIVANGQGHFRYERITAHGLREIVICDGKTLKQLYPELGLGTVRSLSRFHRALIADLLPSLVLPVDDLAKGADVRLIGPRTVAIAPLQNEDEEKVRSKSQDAGKAAKKTAAKEGEEKKVAKSSQRTRVHLVFGEDGRLIERQVVKMPSGKVLFKVTYSDKATIRWIDDTGETQHERKLEIESAQKPQLAPSTSKLVLLPMPIRSQQFVKRSIAERKAKAKAKSDEKKGNENPLEEIANQRDQQRVSDPVNWKEEDVLRLVASYFWQDTNALRNIVARRFFARGDRRIGFYTLLVASGQRWNVDKPVALDDGTTAKMNPVADHAESRLARYLAIQLGEDDKVAKGTDDNEFIRELDEYRQLCNRWSPLVQQSRDAAARLKDLDRAFSFINECRNPRYGLVLLRRIQRTLGDQQPHGRIARAILQIEKKGVTSYVVNYELARSLLKTQKAQAQRLFLQLYRKTLDAGFVPPVDGTFINAIAGLSDLPFRDNENKVKGFEGLVLGTTQWLLKQKKYEMAMALAWQCHQLGQKPLARRQFERLLADSGVNAASAKLALLEYLLATKDYARSAKLIRQLLDSEPFSQSATMWRVAGRVAQFDGRVAAATRYLEKSLDLEYERMPDMFDVTVVKAQYNALFAAYQQLVKVVAVPGEQVSEDLAKRIVRAADRWRSLDTDSTQACQMASKLLTELGFDDLAWDYLTTPLALRPNEASPWLKLAGTLAGRGDIDMADLAYDSAFRAERTNAQILWDHALMLQKAGRHEKAKKVMATLARGDWQPRFGNLKQRAKRQLGE